MFLEFSGKFWWGVFGECMGGRIYSELNTSFPFVFYIPLFIGSRKYAAHCSLIASPFGLPPFVHPPPVPVKAEGKHCRLK
jgi:hypothetical protein